MKTLAEVSQGSEGGEVAAGLGKAALPVQQVVQELTHLQPLSSVNLFFFNCCFQVIILSDSRLKTLSKRVSIELVFKEKKKIVIKSVHVDQLEKLFL